MTERCNCDASCGENRYHDLGSRGCRYEYASATSTFQKVNVYKDSLNQAVEPPPKPPTYNNKHITIPDISAHPKPEEWQMVLKVSEAMEVNEDLRKLQADNEHMKKVLREIFETASEADIVRLALRGLN